MACAAIPGLSMSSEQPELPTVQPTVFDPAKKYVEPLKGPPITNVSRFMACHLELNYGEVSKLISYSFFTGGCCSCVLMAVYVGVVYTSIVNGEQVNGGHC